MLFASAYCERLAYIVPEGKLLLLLAMNVGQGGVHGADIAKPGSVFRRPINVAEGSEVVLQSAPPGLKYDAASNALVWDVPKDFKTGQMVQVIMLVKTPGGKGEYVIEKISVP